MLQQLPELQAEQFSKSVGRKMRYQVKQLPYFFDRTPWLLAARLVRLLFEGGYYSRAAFISWESLETSTVS